MRLPLDTPIAPTYLAHMTTHTATRTITRDDVADNIDLSFTDFSGVSTLKSDHMRGIRNMAVATHNTCAACGLALTGAIELCHIVAAPYGKGITAFNAYVGHKACNDYDREVCAGDPYAIVTRMVRRDLILSEVPSRAVALSYAGNADAAAVALARSAAPAWV